MRIEPRNDVDATAIIRLVNMGADMPGRILDISSGGCRIRTDEPFPVGIFRRVETEFHLEGLPFRIGGVTQAIYDKFSVGVRFLDMSDRKREQLLQLIEEIQEHKRSAELAEKE
jgi:c-di-GMP-binding flagellar brake protein YcgR